MGCYLSSSVKPQDLEVADRAYSKRAFWEKNSIIGGCIPVSNDGYRLKEARAIVLSPSDVNTMLYEGTTGDLHWQCDRLTKSVQFDKITEFLYKRSLELGILKTPKPGYHFQLEGWGDRAHDNPFTMGDSEPDESNCAWLTQKGGFLPDFAFFKAFSFSRLVEVPDSWWEKHDYVTEHDLRKENSMSFLDIYDARCQVAHFRFWQRDRLNMLDPTTNMREEIPYTVTTDSQVKKIRKLYARQNIPPGRIRIVLPPPLT